MTDLGYDVGDTVQVKRSQKWKRDDFTGVVRVIERDEAGRPTCITVTGGNKNGAWRSFVPSRIEQIKPKSKRTTGDQ